MNWNIIAMMARFGLSFGTGFLPPIVAQGVNAAIAEIQKEAGRRGISRDELFARLDKEFPTAGLGPVGQRFVDDIARLEARLKAETAAQKKIKSKSAKPELGFSSPQQLDQLIGILVQVRNGMAA